MAFLTDILAGWLIGFCYDFLKAMRKAGRHRKGIIALCDILFWLIAGVLTVFAFFLTADMELRFYEFLGIFLGFFLYFVAFSVFLQPLHKKILTIFQFFFNFLFTIVRFFVIMIKTGFVFLWKPVVFVTQFLKRFFQKQQRLGKRTLKLIKRI